MKSEKFVEFPFNICFFVIVKKERKDRQRERERERERERADVFEKI